MNRITPGQRRIMAWFLIFLMGWPLLYGFLYAVLYASNVAPYSTPYLLPLISLVLALGLVLLLVLISEAGRRRESVIEGTTEGENPRFELLKTSLPTKGKTKN